MKVKSLAVGKAVLIELQRLVEIGLVQRIESHWTGPWMVLSHQSDVCITPGRPGIRVAVLERLTYLSLSKPRRSPRRDAAR